MSLLVAADPLPIRGDADGVMRIGTTRVTLDTVVGAYCEGMTPEGIVEQYPSLNLGEVYSVLGYYLNHRDEVEVYVRARQAEAANVRRENEARCDPVGIRDRLLARRQG